MNRFFRKCPVSFNIDSRYRPGDGDKYSAIERFFRRIAFNLGNSPSQTEVKIISCIPVDVTELQDRINTLTHELNRELLQNEKLETQLNKKCSFGLEGYQEPIDINFCRHKKRSFSSHMKRHRRKSCKAEHSSTQSDNKSDNPSNSKTYLPKYTQNSHNRSNIINQTQITVTPKNKLPRKKNTLGVVVSRSYVDYYRVGGKRAGRDLDRVCLRKPCRTVRSKPYSKHVGVGFCSSQPAKEPLGHMPETLSFYDDRLYDLVPVKEDADRGTAQTEKQKANLPNKNKTRPIQKVRRHNSNHGPKKDAAFARECQKIYEEMEKRVKGSGGVSSLLSATADLTDLEAEKETDTLLLQIKDILQSLLGEVKTSNHGIDDTKINTEKLATVDAVVQKDLEEQPAFNPSQGYNIGSQPCGYFPSVACAQVYPVLLQNSPIPPFFTGCLHPTNSMSAKNSLNNAQQFPMSTETERLIKEIYNTIALNGLLPNGVNSKKDVEMRASIECLCEDLSYNKKGGNQLHKEKHTQVDKKVREVGTTCVNPVYDMATRQSPPIKYGNIVDRRKVTQECPKVTHERRREIFKVNARNEYQGNYEDDVESVYSEFEDDSTRKNKNIKTLITKVFGKIGRKIRCVNHRLHNKDYHRPSESKTIEYLVPPNKNGYRPYAT